MDNIQRFTNKNQERVLINMTSRQRKKVELFNLLDFICAKNSKNSTALWEKTLRNEDQVIETNGLKNK